MTSKHTVNENNNSLATLDYAPLLDSILKLLQEDNILKFSPDKRKLRISGYDIASKIATKKELQPPSPLTEKSNIKAATVNFSSETEFYSKIQAIRDELKKQLDDACGENKTKACLENLCTALSQFSSNQATLPFNYPFNRAYKFTSERLIIENSFVSERRKGNESAIKAHHLNVRFEGLSKFENQLFESLQLYIAKIAGDDSDELTELLEDISEKESSELTEIRRIVDTESLPRLLRDIKIDYLDYLKRECTKTNIGYSNTEGFECLETLINRLRLLINYINNPDLDDSHFEVSYSLDKPVNLRTAFSQANAFDKLPIIPEYEGLIGESIDKEKGIKEFNLGIRLKLNGSVNTYQEKSVIDYFSNEINPDSQRHKEQLQDVAKAKFFREKVLAIACLYYFIFAVDEKGNIDDKNYNPISKFEEDILNKLKPGASDDEVKEVLCEIKKLLSNGSIWRVSQKLVALKTLLKTLLEKKIVYIQNKQSLNHLIYKISKERPTFRLHQEYLEIHASLSDKEEAEIKQHQNKVKVVFMTASASRGLSFSQAKHILVQIPGFKVEQNLMEIIQVIYRARGGDLDKGNKNLTFYLADKAIYYPNKVDEHGNKLSAAESEKLADISLQEACLNVLNILLILKASIMTRIMGSGKIGRKKYVIIPIGSKAISQAGETFIGSLATLLNEIRKELKKQPEENLLKGIEHKLYELLSVQKTEISAFNKNKSSSTNKEVSYFSIAFQLLSQMETSLDNLLLLPPIEKTYVRGSLLIVPLSNKLVKETNCIDLDKIIDKEQNQDFLSKLTLLSRSHLITS